MSEQATICEQCGGVKMVVYQIQPANMQTPIEHLAPALGVFRMCTGHADADQRWRVAAVFTGSRHAVIEYTGSEYNKLSECIGGLCLSLNVESITIYRNNAHHRHIEVSVPLEQVAKEHDGMLIDGEHIPSKIEYTEHSTVRISYLLIREGLPTTRYLFLSPSQALSLLAWLEQERDILARLAKEQAE